MNAQPISSPFLSLWRLNDGTFMACARQFPEATSHGETKERAFQNLAASIMALVELDGGGEKEKAISFMHQSMQGLRPELMIEQDCADA